MSKSKEQVTRSGWSTRLETVAFPYLLVLPSVLILLGFTVVPTLYATYISAHLTTFLEIREFVGLHHYIQFLQDSRAWNNIWSSIVFTLGSVAGTFVLGYFFAHLLNKKIRFRVGFRTLLLIPWVTNQVASTMLVKWILNYDFGLINSFFLSLGLSPINFFDSPGAAMTSLIAVNTWYSTPYAMVFLLAAIQTVPESVYEAAAIDGANRLQVQWRIVLPILKPQLLVILVLLTMRYFNILTPVMVLTGGGPGTATETLGLRMFKEAFNYYRLDAASAISMIIFFFNILLTAIYVKVLNIETS